MTPFKPILVAVLLASSIVTPAAAQDAAQDRAKRILDAAERAMVQECRQALEKSREERQEALKRARDEQRAKPMMMRRETWFDRLAPCDASR